jgi:hypothetical protein
MSSGTHFRRGSTVPFNSGPRQYTVGIGSVGSYQVSGVPWITGSVEGLASGAEVKITFPSVPKAVTVINTDVDSADIHVHFNSKTLTDVSGGLHYLALNALNDAFTFACKCKEIYISAPTWGGAAASVAGASYTVIAELTGIPTTEMYILTGSGLTTLDGT